MVTITGGWWEGRRAKRGAGRGKGCAGARGGGRRGREGKMDRETGGAVSGGESTHGGGGPWDHWVANSTTQHASEWSCLTLGGRDRNAVRVCTGGLL